MAAPLSNRHWMVWVFCAAATFASAGAGANNQPQSPRIKDLIQIASQGRGIYGSGLLDEDPFEAEDVPQALIAIKKHPDYTSYFLLMAIRWHHPKSYQELPNETKIAVLCSALKNVSFLNDWGTLKSDGFATAALVETEKAALPSLIPLLDDNAPALLGGSKEAFVSKIQGFRRKDFAYRCVSRILGDTPVFHRDPRERDKEIEALKKRLKVDPK
jgi:hypothetical protein